MLQIIFPVAYVSIAIGKVLCAFAMHLTFLKVTLVPGLVWPYYLTFAIHIVELELAFVQLTRVCKIILSEAMELSVLKVTFIVATFEFESPVA